MRKPNVPLRAKDLWFEAKKTHQTFTNELNIPLVAEELDFSTAGGLRDDEPKFLRYRNSLTPPTAEYCEEGNVNGSVSQ